MSVRAFAGHDGFTLVEIMVATAMVGIGLVGVAAALQHGLSGIETGRGESVAIFLAEHKLEELRALALVDWTDLALQPGTMTEYCQPSAACSATPTPDSFRRTTTVTAGSGRPCTAQCKIVSVAVVYRPITAMGQLAQERRIEVDAMFVSRA
jgi:prepilin-type N-terminal cleavage/methylation domain-containing protein